MCGGPSAEEKNLSNEEAEFYKTQINAYNTAYSNFSGIQNALNQQFAPILARGPGQTGYTAEELNALKTQSTEGTAAEFAKASAAANQAIASRGGGQDVTNITSGGAQELSGQLAATAAAEAANEKLGILQSNYALGRQNYNQAISGEESLAAGWNPNSFAGSATSAGNAAGEEASRITQESESVWGNVMGALGGIGGAAIGNLNVGPFKQSKG